MAFLNRLGSLFGDEPIPQGGVMGEPQVQQMYNPKLAMAAQLLAGSNSGTGFGEIMGKALMAGQQARQMAAQQLQEQRKAQTDEEFKRAQIGALKNRDTQFGNVDPDQFTPESLQAFQQSGDYGVLRRRPDANLGNFNPGDYTPASFAKFRQTGEITDLERWVTPATPIVEKVGNVPTLISPNRVTGSATTRPLSTLAGEATGAAVVKGAEASASAAGNVSGAAGAQALIDLPKVESTADQAIGTINQLVKHPGLPYITGAASLSPIIPNTDQAGADALAAQVEGQAFLQAFQTLKGGGTITEREGQAATAAIGRLKRAQKTEDYVKALGELKDIATSAKERAKKQITPPAGIRRYNPETGRIE